MVYGASRRREMESGGREGEGGAGSGGRGEGVRETGHWSMEGKVHASQRRNETVGVGEG